MYYDVLNTCACLAKFPVLMRLRFSKIFSPKLDYTRKSEGGKRLPLVYTSFYKTSIFLKTLRFSVRAGLRFRCVSSGAHVCVNARR